MRGGESFDGDFRRKNGDYPKVERCWRLHQTGDGDGWQRLSVQERKKLERVEADA